MKQVVFILLLAPALFASDIPLTTPTPNTHQCFYEALACGDQRVGETHAFGCRTEAGLYYDIYTLFVDEGRYLTLRTNADFNPQIVIYEHGPGGRILRADNAPGTNSSEIRDYQVTRTGYVDVVVTGTRAGATGTYSLTVSCATTPGGANTGPEPPGGCLSSGRLLSGQTVNGALSTSDECTDLADTTFYDVYSYEAREGFPLRVTYTAAYAPYIEVTTSDTGQGVFRSSEGNEVTFEYVPEFTGTIWLFLGANTETKTTGAYTIRVEELTPDPCRRRAVGH